MLRRGTDITGTAARDGVIESTGASSALFSRQSECLQQRSNFLGPEGERPRAEVGKTVEEYRLTSTLNDYNVVKKSGKSRNSEYRTILQAKPRRSERAIL